MRTSKGYLLIIVLAVLLAGLCSCQGEREVHVGIIPLGKVDAGEITLVRKALEENYGYKVDVLPGRELPSFAFVNIKSSRYRADSLIAWMKRTRPDSISHVIGITASDISTTKRINGKIKEPASKYSDWGIFGLGYRPGPSCIVSTYRLKMKVDPNGFHDRLRKVSVHELGHCLGLRHCPDQSCVMTDALERISTVDQAGFTLCQDCRTQLRR